MMAARKAAGAGRETLSPLAAIAEQYPGWRPWRSRDGSRKGRWWATRVGGRRPANAPHWWAMTVSGDSPEELRRELEGQMSGHPG